MVIQEGRRERKKRQTREAIVAAAFTLFAERGFDAVTVTEIAELADVARATLFSYFPTKESIVLGVVGDDDPADIVASRPPGTTPLDGLRRHYRAFAAGGAADSVAAPGAGPDLLTSGRVIAQSPALTAAAGRLLDGQRAKLAAALAAEADAGDEIWPALAAAQICAVLSALKSGFLGRLAGGEPFAELAGRLPGEVELAFDLLEHGIGGLWPAPGQDDSERR